MRLVILPALALAIASAAPATAQRSFTPQTTPVPLTVGRLAFNNKGTGQLYLYDFKHAALSPLIQGGNLQTGLSHPPENPKFAPGGQALVFAAVEYYPNLDQNDQYQYHVFYLPIPAGGVITASSVPVNLTGWMGNLRNEDPQFSPDGTKLTWKQHFNIVTAPVTYDEAGTPTLGTPTPVTTNGAQMMSTEASGPTFTPDGGHLLYWTGSKHAIDSPWVRLWKYNLASRTPMTVGITQKSTIDYYYPVAPGLYGFLYVSWLNPGNTHDKIFLFSGINNASNVWNPTDCAADNSDPAPVNDDFFVYARRDGATGSSYQLTLGQLSSGRAWSLSPLGVNGAAGNTISGDVYGPDYTAAD